MAKSSMSKKLGKYKIQGRLSGNIYARARSLREARAKRWKVAETRFIDESNLDIVGPMEKVVLRGNHA